MKLPPIGPTWFSSVKNDSVLNDGQKTPVKKYAFIQSEWIKMR